jgi:cell division protein FtsA
VLTGGSDARELMSVPTAGDNERDAPQIVSRATIANIVRHRAEEIFEMVRDRLADSPFAAEPKARVVLSGGASQLTGVSNLQPRFSAGRSVSAARSVSAGCPTRRRARPSRFPRVSGLSAIRSS